MEMGTGRKSSKHGGIPTALGSGSDTKVLRASPLPSTCSHLGEKTSNNSRQHLIRTKPHAVDFVQ